MSLRTFVLAALVTSAVSAVANSTHVEALLPRGASGSSLRSEVDTVLSKAAEKQAQRERHERLAQAARREVGQQTCRGLGDPGVEDRPFQFEQGRSPSYGFASRRFQVVERTGLPSVLDGDLSSERIVKYSAAGEAVEVELTWVHGEISGYRVIQACGAGFGFPEPTVNIVPATPEVAAQLEELTNPFSGSAFDEGAIPDWSNALADNSKFKGNSKAPPPQKTTPVSQKTTQPPQKTSQPPQKTSQPPQKTTQPPQKTSQPPQKTTGLPKVTTEPKTTDSSKGAHSTKSVPIGSPAAKYVPNPNNPRTPTKNGGYIEDRGNHKIVFRSDGTPEEVRTSRGTTVYNKKGEPAQFRRANGTTTTYHSDGTRTVTNGSGKQVYTEKSHGSGENKVTRTYTTTNNTTVVRNYHVHVHDGFGYYAYEPLFYNPYVYRYYYDPYAAPLRYRWWWGGDPWYGYYDYYFRPYDYYPRPSYWLTDYLLADMLARQYAQAAAARNLPSASSTPAASPALTDEMKDQIRAQVEETLKAHQSKTSIPVTELVRDTRRIFPVSEEMEVFVEATGGKCTLGQGNLIRPVHAAAGVAEMLVIASTRGNCPAGTRVTLSLEQLQEFQNDFVEGVERGMTEYRSRNVDHNSPQLERAPMSEAPKGSTANSTSPLPPVGFEQNVSSMNLYVRFPNGKDYQVRRIWVTRPPGSTQVTLQYELQSLHRNSPLQSTGVLENVELAAMLPALAENRPLERAQALRILQILQTLTTSAGSWNIQAVR